MSGFLILLLFLAKVDMYDAVIIGGGLAGLTAANHLARKQKRVLVIEKNAYPNHKVCGEYLSMEVLPYLQGMDIDLRDAVNIDHLEISHKNGNILKTTLPLGGIGISRYALDNRMYQSALSKGAEFLFENAESIQFRGNTFEIKTTNGSCFESKVVIGAFGKRSSLDKSLGRDFIKQKAPWLGVKAHYDVPGFQQNSVGLHAFDGGYGGLSKTETGAVNFCYLASYKSFKPYGNIKDFAEGVVMKNPHLKDILGNAEMKFTKPLTIAQISFNRKQTIENHMLMCGDSAGLIHPLCGNGMAMAIHSARIASDLVLKFLNQPDFNRQQLEMAYEKSWRNNFADRLLWGRILQSLLLNQTVSNVLIKAFINSQSLTRALIRKTHGKLLEA